MATKKEETTKGGAKASATKLTDKENQNIEFAKKILAQSTEVDTVYIIDDLFFSDKERAEARSESTGGKIYTVTRNSAKDKDEQDEAE